MDISFRVRTFSKGTSRLPSPLRYFCNYISSVLKLQGFESSFQEVEIHFVYPPYKLNKLVIKEEFLNQFYELYSNLPDTGFKNKRQKVIVSVMAPEFSEFCDQNETDDGYLGITYIEQKIDPQYLNIPLITLAEIILKKLGDSIILIKSKLKKNEFLNVEQFLKTIDEIKSQLSESFLINIEAQYLQLEDQDTLTRNNEDRIQRQNVVSEPKRLIRDIRLMYCIENWDLKMFSPYENRLCNIILNRLRELKFRCPNYDHLYIMVSETREKALLHAIRAENWFVYGLAVFTNK